MKDNTIRFIKEKDFTYIREIGQGATGKTVLLKDETIGEYFVCKKYSPYYPDDKKLYYENFVNEIKILYKINHQNIVRIFNYYLYPYEKTGYILMEFVDGVSIDQYIKSNNQSINNIFFQVIQGFQYLEQINILHRDIRTSNVLVTTGEIVKIIDFGFGKYVASPNYCNKSITLNWEYQVPDDFSKQIYDFKTEIYFIGKLFEKIISDNNLNSIFKFVDILSRMINPKYDNRINSFNDILSEISSDNLINSNFMEKDKIIYSNFADSLSTIFLSLSYSVKYIDDANQITQSMKEIIQKTSLEKYIQNNDSLIHCFIQGSFKYKNSIYILVSCLTDFFDWWNKLSASNRNLVLYNLWGRFDRVDREDYSLPF